MKHSDIPGILDWGGAWAVRAAFEDVVLCILKDIPFDFEGIKSAIGQSSGECCQRYVDRINHLTGRDFALGNTSKPSKPIIYLAALETTFESASKAQYWRQLLLEHFRVREHELFAAIDEAKRQEPLLRMDQSAEWLDWSFAALNPLLRFSGDQKTVVYHPNQVAVACWKRWYFDQFSQRIIWTDFLPEEGVSAAKVLVHKFVHEATHLMHMSAYPEVAALLPSPPMELTMEAVAMAAEHLFWQMLRQVGVPLFPFETDSHAVEGILLMGFYERAMRVQYDVMVHQMGVGVEEWVEWAVETTGFPASFFAFANEFWGLPGFAAGYSLGMEAFLVLPDDERLQLIAGKITVDGLINHKIYTHETYSEHSGCGKD